MSNYDCYFDSRMGGSSRGFHSMVRYGLIVCALVALQGLSLPPLMFGLRQVYPRAFSRACFLSLVIVRNIIHELTSKFINHSLRNK